MSKTETNYQLAQATGTVVQGEEAGVFVNPSGKQGHKCCGGCCDVRRAVMIVNGINIIILGMSLLSFLAAKNIANNNTDDAAAAQVDDQVQEAIDIYANAPLGAIIAIMLVQAVISAIGMAGAFIFNKWMVGVTAVVYVLGLLGALLSLNPGGMAYNGFFLYPHVFLIKELHRGIMTKENYEPVEKHSCCCV